jgi:hypothetical protein
MSVADLNPDIYLFRWKTVYDEECGAPIKVPSLKDYPEKVRLYISVENTKMGGIWSFSIPPDRLIIGRRQAITCPGSTCWCRVWCYAKHAGKQPLPNVQLSYARNLVYVLRHTGDPGDLADKLVKAINKALEKGEKPLRDKVTKRYVFRLHTAGDFFAEWYIEAWAEVAKKLKDWQFYAYTRSWRVPSLKKRIEQDLMSLDNFTVLASTDFHTGPPPEGWYEACVVDSREPYRMTSSYLPTERCPEEIEELQEWVRKECEEKKKRGEECIEKITCGTCLKCAFGRFVPGTFGIRWEIVR